jgi:hypothetical protein
MARSFNAGSSRSLTQTASPLVNANSAGAVTGWFKTSDAGTTRLTIYNESAVTDGNINLFVALNDTVNGRIRVFRRDATPTSADMTWDGSLANGAWHHFCYRWGTLAEHELIVDGISRATSVSNLTGTKTVNAKAIGRRESPTGTASGYFTGDLADIATWTVDIGSAGATSLSNKSKHPMNLRATWADLNSYWPLAQGALPGDRDVFDYRDLFGRSALTINNGTTAVDGPDGVGPTAMVAATDISKAWILSLTGTTLVTRGASAGDQDRLLREPGNVIHDGTATPFKLYYAGSDDPYNGGDVAILLATATTIGGSWTKQGVVIANATLPQEDPWVYRDPATGTYHLYAENKTGGTNADGISHFTSSDGVSWSVENASAIVEGVGGQWDETDVSSPIVVKIDGTWYMLYEGRGIGNAGKIGLATASSPNGPWTKSGSNPVMGLGAGGTWDDDSVVPDGLVKIGSTYWLTYHASPDAGATYRVGIASSPDLITWTKAAHNPMSSSVWGLAHFQNPMATDFDRGYADFIPSTDLGELQLWGDAAAQTSEWPDAGLGDVMPMLPTFATSSITWAP